MILGIAGERELGRTVDVAVTGYGYRSVSGVPYPLDVNDASMDELRMLPGVGKQRAGNILVNRPYDSVDEVAEDVDIARFCEAGRAPGAD